MANHPAALLYVGSVQACWHAALIHIKKIAPAYAVHPDQRIIDGRVYPIFVVSPQKDEYQKSELEEIFPFLRHTYSADKPAVCIFTAADAFNPASANLMLKIVEEPHANLYFIFFADSKEGILPTLASRMHVQYVEQKEHANQAVHEFVALIKRGATLLEFEPAINEYPWSEKEVKILLEQIMADPALAMRSDTMVCIEAALQALDQGIPVKHIMRLVAVSFLQ